MTEYLLYLKNYHFSIFYFINIFFIIMFYHRCYKYINQIIFLYLFNFQKSISLDIYKFWILSYELKLYEQI